MTRSVARFAAALALAHAAIDPAVDRAAADAFAMELVTVGNPGNAADTRYNSISVGSVGYNYRIGKYEVTAGQYTEFLNAVAKADPNGLYNPSMADPGPSYGANIQRTGASPNYNYSVAADWALRPVNYVSFWDASRFSNWLHNGQPIGPQGPGTTEDGAYHDVGDQALFGRNPGARFFIPSEDEWYKAAYHNKTAGLAASYFDFPAGTNVFPLNDVTETTQPGNNANHFTEHYAIGSPYFRTVAGEFELSDSPYGTFDQGGNVSEWNETVLNGSSQGLRGGSYVDIYYNQNAVFRSTLFGPTVELDGIGFRVASIPKPGDFDLDNDVDGADFLKWQRGESPNPGSASDLALWSAKFGAAPLQSTTSTVPEPATGALLLGALAGGNLPLRRRAPN